MFVYIVTEFEPNHAREYPIEIRDVFTSMELAVAFLGKLETRRTRDHKDLWWEISIWGVRESIV